MMEDRRELLRKIPKIDEVLQDERLYNMTYVNLAQSQEALVAEQAKNRTNFLFFLAV